MKRALSDTKLDGGGESSTKLVEVELFRETRKIGVFAKGIVTDLLSAIEMFRRDVVKKGRDVALSAERLAGVDRALAESSDSPFNSVQQLREAISRWHQEHRDRWDADTHYDARRARAYAAHNAVPQKVLTDRALELAGMPPGTDLQHKLVLDLGGGTGLSSKAFQDMGAWTINVDLSSHMLHESTAHDAVRLDMGQPLPFREGSFDAAVSMSALHYLCEDEVGTARGHQDRLRACFSSVRRCVNWDPSTNHPVVFQFFPQPSESDPTFANRTREAARAEGLAATVVVDQPHHTAGWRWFLRLEPQERTALRSCQQCALYHPSGASCVLSLADTMAKVDSEHQSWMLTEHAKFARRLIRTRAHILREQAAAGGAAEEKSGDGGAEDRKAPSRKKGAKRQKRQRGHGMSAWEVSLSDKLTAELGAEVTLEELKGAKRNQLMAALHER